MNWSKARVLVTGGAGFIGSHLTRRLTTLNADVIVLDNFSSGLKENLSFYSGELVESNVIDGSVFNEINGDIDYVFHFGAPSSVILFNKDPVSCFNETCSGFLNIINFAIKKNVKKIVFPSSGSVYGSVSPPQSEKDTPAPLNIYGLAKLTCEHIAQFYSPQIRSVGLRIFAGYGPGESHKGEISSPVTLFLRSLLKNQKPVVYGNGLQRRDFVYIDDIVEAILKSAQNAMFENPFQIVNVGSGRSYSFNETIALINEFLGTNIETVFTSKPATYLERTLADTTFLREKLGLTPILLEDGLKRYLQTCKKTGFEV